MTTFNIETAHTRADKIRHSMQELGNVRIARKLENEWVKTRGYPPAIQFISELHKILFQGTGVYEKKGISQNDPGVVRKDNVWAGGSPRNFYVNGDNTSYAFGEYCRKLNEVLELLPNSPLQDVESVTRAASWAYYTFVRIHPFLEGNGRIGRMILRRVLVGAGFRDPAFGYAMEVRNKTGRDKHLDAMKQVDATANLACLDRYILEMLLLPAYLSNNGNESNLVSEMQRVYLKKREETESQRRVGSIGDIWPPFADLGVASPLEIKEFERTQGTIGASKD